MAAKIPINIIAIERRKRVSITKILLLIARTNSPVIVMNNTVHIANNSVFALCKAKSFLREHSHLIVKVDRLFLCNKNFSAML